MGAIAGVVRLSAGADVTSLVAAIAGRMAHRAPDGIACWNDAHAALANGRLWTTPEAPSERQPVLLDNRIAIVVDGRIDNRAELIRELGCTPDAAPTLTDADLFARAWMRWGEAMTGHIVGDFAMAIWDAEARCLWLLRDRMGVRPLYFARTPRMLAFASEAEALLGLDGISTAPNDDRIGYYLVPGFDDGDREASWYRDVRKLTPGGRLRLIATGNVDIHRYWRCEPQPELRLRDHREYVDAFLDVFTEAVRCRMRSQAPASLMLSGGIDSASIYAMAQRIRADGGGSGLLPLAVISDHPEGCDETANILRMLAHAGDAGVRLSVPSFDGPVTAGEFRDMPWTPAHPVDNSILLPMLAFMAARKSGSNVMLDGIDGDLVTATPNNYVGRLLLSGRPVSAWREARLAGQVHTYLHGQAAWHILGAAVGSRLEPRTLALLRYRVMDRVRGDGVLGKLIDPVFAHRLRLRERMLERQTHLRCDGSLRSHQGYLAYLWDNPGFSRGMEGFDHCAGRFGVEPRHPWCDQRVVELFMRLPMDIKVRDGWTKHLVRSACAPALGAEVAWHSGKAHLGPQVAARLVAESPAPIRSALEDRPGALGGFVDQTVLRGLLERWERNALSGVDLDDVLSVTTLSRWLQGLVAAGN